MGLHSNANLQAFPAHIRLGWMREAVANTVAYYVTATITAVKCFIVQTPAGANVIKPFFSITVGSSLPTNIMPGWKSLSVTNTLAYYKH